jgi:hypothetical protein
MWVLLPGPGLVWVSAVFLTVVTALSCHGVQPSVTPSWATFAQVVGKPMVVDLGAAITEQNGTHE